MKNQVKYLPSLLYHQVMIKELHDKSFCYKDLGCYDSYEEARLPAWLLMWHSCKAEHFAMIAL